MKTSLSGIYVSGTFEQQQQLELSNKTSETKIKKKLKKLFENTRRQTVDASASIHLSAIHTLHSTLHTPTSLHPTSCAERWITEWQDKGQNSSSSVKQSESADRKLSCL